MLWLLLGLIFLAVLFLWVAARPDTWETSRTHLRIGAVLLLVLAVLVGYGLYQESISRTQLEKILPVYPNADTTVWMPQVSSAKYWMLETEDGLDQIADFYASEAAQSGWLLTASREKAVLLLKIELANVNVSVMASREDDMTQLVYQVTRGISN